MNELTLTYDEWLAAQAHEPVEPKHAPLPDSDTWRGIGHKALDTFGPEFEVASGFELTGALPTPPSGRALANPFARFESHHIG